eukprot:744568-Amphidinium_carterae.1
MLPRSQDVYPQLGHHERVIRHCSAQQQCNTALSFSTTSSTFQPTKTTTRKMVYCKALKYYADLTFQL